MDTQQQQIEEQTQPQEEFELEPAPSEQVQVQEPAPTEQDDLAAQLEREREERRKLEEKLLQADPFALVEEELPPPPSEEEPAEREQEPTAPQQPPTEVPSFLTPEEYSEVLIDPQKLNEVLYRVVQRTREEVLREVARMRESEEAYRRRVAEAERRINEFFEKNADLKEHRTMVETVALGMIRKNPSLGLDKVLELAGSSVRKLHRKGTQPPPGFTSSGPPETRREYTPLTKFDEEVQKLFG